jgi:hypothetical protein
MKTYVCEFCRPLWPIDECYPVVRIPFGEHSRVIKSENVDVGPVSEIVCHYTTFASAVVGADHADTGWVVAFQHPDKLFSPFASCHSALYAQHIS